MDEWPGKLNFDFDKHISQLKNELLTRQDQERVLDDRLKHLYDQGAKMPKNLHLSLARSRSRLLVLESDARQLDSLLDMTSSLADDVSSKVRQLDLCKSRIVDCLQRVEDALDLRFCTEGIRSAMANEDYEQAAAHVHRFLTLNQSIFGLTSTQMNGEHDVSKLESQSVNQDAATFEHQFSIMKRAEVELRKILFEKFDEASKKKDVASMERFFKLFPSINQQKEGMEKFGAYLKTKISDSGQDDKDTASRESVEFSDRLTVLLENAARIFEIHQPIVENYYGAEYLLVLAQILQEQIDQEASKIVDQFVKRRQYVSKSKLIDSYNQGSKTEPKEKLDPLELDQLLSEVTLLQTRSELYFRFIKRRLKNSLNKREKPSPALDQQILVKNDQNQAEKSSGVENAKFTVMQRLDNLIRNCGLNCRMQELIGRYVAMEQYYTREMLKRAIALNDAESRSSGETSTLVDDAFYVIRKSVKRASSSSNVDCLCAVLNNACALLETDFLGLFQLKIKAGYPASGSLAEAYSTAAAAYVSVVQQGKMAPSSLLAAGAKTDGAEKARAEFLAALNDADGSAESARSLLELLRQEMQLSGGQDNVNQQQLTSAKIDGCLSQLADTALKFDQLAQRGLDRLLEAALKARLKMLAERLADHGHVIDDAQFDQCDAGDPFVEHFVTAFDALIDQFKGCLSSTNHRRLFDLLIEEACKQLEKCTLRCQFNRLGALLFDKRVREISAYYAGMGSGYATREKFGRLSQIASILNVDSVAEAREFYQSSNVAWRISASDVRKILTTRLDLSSEDVRKLKL